MNATEPSGYAEAVAELDEILESLDDDELDVDALATRVERAAELIRFCRSRIADAKVHVERVVAEFGPDRERGEDEADEIGSDEHEAGAGGQE